MDIRIEIDEQSVKDLITAHLEKTLGEIEIDTSKISIEVKSKQNWRAEWEPAHFRAVYNKIA